MKKVFYALVVTLYWAASVQAQCPTRIEDNVGDGTYYFITISSQAQCANFPLGGTVTLNSQIYDITDCSTSLGATKVEIAPQGTPVVLLTNAPITFSGGGESNCMYNSVGNPIALPIELIEFKGTPSVSGNVLTWTTVREVSNRGFQVERLVSDKTWMPLSFVKSKGAYGTYQFTDYNPLATSYYRLRQLDNDGKETFSKVVTVAAKGVNKLKVYPNPVGNVLTVETDNKDAFQILNLLGQSVLSGKTAQRIDVSALPQGAYFLKVGTEQVKFIKQ
jgi:Secretion system C-terminal sorting domain